MPFHVMGAPRCWGWRAVPRHPIPRAKRPQDQSAFSSFTTTALPLREAYSESNTGPWRKPSRQTLASRKRIQPQGSSWWAGGASGIGRANTVACSGSKAGLTSLIADKERGGWFGCGSAGGKVRFGGPGLALRQARPGARPPEPSPRSQRDRCRHSRCTRWNHQYGGCLSAPACDTAGYQTNNGS